MQRLKRRGLVLFAVLGIMFGGIGQAEAVPVFTFDVNDEGWTNQATEPFSVAFAPGAGFGGGGALAISALSNRDSYQIVHAEDPDWPTTLSFFQQITFDVRLEPGVEISFSATGMQIRDNIGNESNVYLATNSIDLGSGYTRVFMEPTNLFNLPQSHDDVGLNLHVGTTSAFRNSLVMVIDNIAGTPCDPSPSACPPQPHPRTLHNASPWLRSGWIRLL